MTPTNLPTLVSTVVIIYMLKIKLEHTIRSIKHDMSFPPTFMQFTGFLHCEISISKFISPYKHKRIFQNHYIISSCLKHVFSSKIFINMKSSPLKLLPYLHILHKMAHHIETLLVYNTCTYFEAPLKIASVSLAVLSSI